MSLKQLIVVRHGEHQQIRELSEALFPRVTGFKIAILSSTASRAWQTAKILAERFGGIEVVEEPCLSPDSRRQPLTQVTAREALIVVAEKQRTHEIVILSTHKEYVDRFPTYWGKTMNLDIPVVSDTPKGTARIIDARNGKVIHVQVVHA